MLEDDVAAPILLSNKLFLRFKLGKRNIRQENKYAFRAVLLAGVSIRDGLKVAYKLLKLVKPVSITELSTF